MVVVMAEVVVVVSQESGELLIICTQNLGLKVVGRKGTLY